MLEKNGKGNYETLMVEAPPMKTGLHNNNIYDDSSLSNYDNYADDPHLRGSWRDSFYDCFKHGLFHPSVLIGFCCPQILLAQVMTRLRLTWLGGQSFRGEWKSTFRKVLCLVLLFYFITYLAYTTPRTYKVVVDDNGRARSIQISQEPYRALTVINNLINFILGLYTFLVMWRVRQYIRKRYQIPDGSLGRCDDCCSVFWCSCCTVAHMARHTGDYNSREATFLAADGLSIAEEENIENRSTSKEFSSLLP